MPMTVQDLCLGVLSLGEATGYEIRKAFEEGGFSHFMAASYGSIYPALLKLANDGCVTLREESQDGRPDRKVYAITQKGRQAFSRTLETDPALDAFRSEFLFLVMFPRLLTRARLATLIDARIARLEGLAAQFSHNDCPAEAALKDLNWRESGAAFARGYGIAVYSAEAAYLRANRHLLEDMAKDAAPIPATAAQ